MEQASASSGETLSKLVNEQLSAVVFVQNYLQLDFDGRRLTLHIWPTIRSADGEVQFGSIGYRDTLCSFIASKVVRATETSTAIEVWFDRGSLLIDLAADAPAERLIFEDTLTNDWAWW